MSVASFTEFVELRGLRLRVSRVGEGPPLLLINGLGAPLEMWAPLIEQLAAVHELVSFDLPGCGMSATAHRPLGVRGMAAIAAGVLDAVGLERAHVLGYSLGGFVAQELAHRDPERIDRLVLAATSAGCPSAPPTLLAAWLMLTPTRYLSEEAGRMIVPVIAGGRTRDDRVALDAEVRRRVTHPPSFTGYFQQIQAASWFSSHAWIGTVRHPALVLGGDSDPLIPVINTRYLGWRLPRGEVRVLSGAGHLMLFDQAPEASEVIRGFLQRSD